MVHSPRESDINPASSPMIQALAHRLQRQYPTAGIVTSTVCDSLWIRWVIKYPSNMPQGVLRYTRDVAFCTVVAISDNECVVWEEGMHSDMIPEGRAGSIASPDLFDRIVRSIESYRNLMKDRHARIGWPIEYE